MQDELEGYFRENVLSVSEINGYVKELFDGIPIFSSLKISGEISNFKRHMASGHLYFSLKDESSALKAVMFRSSAADLRFEPENGMRVIAHGRLSAYPRDGAYQLYVSSLEPDGIGGFYIAFEKLKKKLSAEGLFSAERKKPIPELPRTVGVITSPTGAAVRDIINVTSRRYPLAKLLIFPALVQGDGAVPSLIAGLRCFNAHRTADVIIIGRGGGSIEDLWAFNSEELAREIAASQIPVISAVGHETDFTICDLVSDLRAPTPSAAAELAVPDISELYRRINNAFGTMQSDILGMLETYRQHLSSLASKRVMRSPDSLLDYKRERLDRIREKLTAAMCDICGRDRAALERLSAKLNALSPLAVMSRGFGAAFDKGGRMLRSARELPSGTEFVLKLSDGSVKAVSMGETVAEMGAEIGTGTGTETETKAET